MNILRNTLALLNIPSRARRQGVVRHHSRRFARLADAGFVADRQPDQTDRRIAARLLQAYALTRAEEKRRRLDAPTDIWSGIKGQQARFHALLDRADESALAAYLCNMCRHDATIGTIQGNLEYWKLRANPLYRRYLTRMFKDKLVCLAEGVGAMPCENPEQGPWGEHMGLPAEDIVRRIEAVLGIEIAPPPVDGGLYKIHTGRGSFHERDLNALFTAWTLNRLVPNASQARICEIGAGTGRVAYWSRRFGTGSYTILDLPQVNVIQAYYLLRSLPEDAVVLFGESATPTVAGHIIVLPYFCKDDLNAAQFDLVLNQDSFPEISRAVVMGYLGWIRRVSRHLFLSINHESRPSAGGGEAQISVPELVAEAGGFQRLSRHPYWLRQGYVAELYAVIDAGAEL